MRSSTFELIQIKVVYLKTYGSNVLHKEIIDLLEFLFVWKTELEAFDRTNCSVRYWTSCQWQWYVFSWVDFKKDILIWGASAGSRSRNTSNIRVAHNGSPSPFPTSSRALCFCLNLRMECIPVLFNNLCLTKHPFFTEAAN